MQDGITPLMFACSSGRNNFVSILLDSGADVHAKDEEECTALHFAARNGHDDVCHNLLESGANVSGRKQSIIVFRQSKKLYPHSSYFSSKFS